MILLIDGRSGSGKTTFAQRIHNALGWPVIHLEDVYPGWNGLAVASELVASSILNPHLSAAQRGYRRWDWYANDFAEWVPTPKDTSLIIEGCGAVTAANLDAASRLGDGQVWGIWVDLDTHMRFTRAMARDAAFASHWQMWADQEDTFYATHQPQALAQWQVNAALL